MEANTRELLAALDDVVRSMEFMSTETDAIRRHAEAMRTSESDLSDGAFASGGAVVRRVSKSVERLNTAASRLRRAQARALRDEGVGVQRIGSLLGVSHQRVSALLKPRNLMLAAVPARQDSHPSGTDSDGDPYPSDGHMQGDGSNGGRTSDSAGDVPLSRGLRPDPQIAVLTGDFPLGDGR